MFSLKADVEASQTALLSQEGSTIETTVEIVRGVVPKRNISSGEPPLASSQTTR